MNVPLQVAEDEFFSAAKQMSHWLERILGPHRGQYRPRDMWSPAVNLYEEEEAYYLVADLAGIRTDSIDLRAEGGKLILQGQRVSPRPPGAESGTRAVRLHLMEIDHGPFQRVLELPPNVAGKKIEACYRNGLLWVKLPKGTAKE